ncbi:MAG: hypothetical protein ACRDG9_15120, partial [Actinomycetota bacterium]
MHWRVTARHRAARFFTPAVAVMLIGLAGCQDNGGGQQEALGKAPSTPNVPVPEFDPENFSDPTTIDNKWLP